MGSLTVLVPQLQQLSTDSVTYCRSVNCCWPSPAQSFLASVYSRSVTKMFISESESYVTTDSQSASLCWNRAPIWGLQQDFYYCQKVAGFLMWGALAWRVDGSVVYNCYWPSPAQSFLGPSPVGLVMIFYCLRFETSFFVTSYDSQAYGGGIRPRLHTGLFISLDLSCL
jgi:hypothetical protein